MAMTFPSNPTTGQQYSVSGGPTYTWDGTVWKILTPGSQFSEQQFTATAGQTSFTVSGGYVIGAVDVYRNGVKLVIGLDFTATDLSTVVLTNAASAGDTIEVVKAAQILYADALKRTGDTMTGPLTLGGLLDTGATGQIKFPAAQNASSDANTLDDYEEGTWTPVLRGAGTAGVYTLTVDTNGATYTKVGRKVSVNCSINVTATPYSAGTGYAQITGLPFANAGQAVGSCYFSGVDLNVACAWCDVSFISANQQTTVYFDTVVDNSSSIDTSISGFGPGSIIRFGLTYFTS